MATYKSLDSLKSAILKEVRSAVDATAKESKNVLQKNVDEFYTIPEGRYHRIGMLQAAPQLDTVFETKMELWRRFLLIQVHSTILLEEIRETIYGYAEADGLIGKGGFWERSKEEIPRILEEEIEKRLG